MISPYVRRRRLAAELIRLREEHGYSTQRLAQAINLPRQRISQLQNGHLRPDQDEIIRILDMFKVGERRWDQIMTIAREAQERGWWEKFRDEMGPRQALYADLEAGARSIAEYQMTLLPGLLQIPAFTEVRARANRGANPEHFDPTRALEARVIRQRVLDRAGGPGYEVIIDELAVRRFAAPPDVVRAQLDHAVQVGHDRKKITIRVLPLSASIPGHVVPGSAFFTYRYPDPGDPIVVAVDTVTSDLVLAEPAETSHYLDLYQRLRQAALTPADSLDFLTAAAEELPDYAGSRQMNRSKFTNWCKSRRSDGASNCVEVAFAADGTVGVRDSKNRTGPILEFTPTEWTAFTGSVRDGEFHFDTGERDHHPDDGARGAPPPAAAGSRLKARRPRWHA